MAKVSINTAARRKETWRINEMMGRICRKGFPSGNISDFEEGDLPISYVKHYLQYHKSWDDLIHAVKVSTKKKEYSEYLRTGKCIEECFDFEKVYFQVASFLDWLKLRTRTNE